MKKTIPLLIVMLLACSNPVLAHDEGHGPKLTDTGHYGGIVTAVVQAKDADKGEKAPLVYKAELARSEDGTVRIYVYDKDMKPLASNILEKTAKAILISPQGKKFLTEEFKLKLEGASYIGKAPKPSGKPFSIDITFKSKSGDLLAGFNNLD